MTEASATHANSYSYRRHAARERDVIGRVTRVVAGIFFVTGSILTYSGHPELSGLALLGGLAAAIASATQHPKRIGGWLGVTVFAAALSVVVIASVL